MNDSPSRAVYSPETLDAFERVGQPAEEFAGSPTTAYTMIVLGVLGMIVGVGGTIFFIYYIATNGFNSKSIRALAIPFVAPVGWYAFKKGLQNRFVRMYLCEKGLVLRKGLTLTVFPFEDIAEVVQDKVKDGLDENGLPHMKRGVTFLIKRNDGATIGIDENTLKKPQTFARSLYRATRDYDTPWNLHQG